MQNDRKEPPGEHRRLSDLIITRSPSSRSEIPGDNLSERDSDDRACEPAGVEQSDTGGEVGQQG